MIEAQAILDAVVSHAMSTGRFDAVNQHEPKNAPGHGLTCAIWVQSIEPAVGQHGLIATTARFTLSVRLYTSMLAEPQDLIDPYVVGAVDMLMGAYSSDFTLDGLVRNVDLLGQGGQGMRADAGYLNVSGNMMRVMTISLPLIVNDVWSQQP